MLGREREYSRVEKSIDDTHAYSNRQYSRNEKLESKN